MLRLGELDHLYEKSISILSLSGRVIFIGIIGEPHHLKYFISQVIASK